MVNVKLGAAFNWKCKKKNHSLKTVLLLYRENGLKWEKQVVR